MSASPIPEAVSQNTQVYSAISTSSKQVSELIQHALDRLSSTSELCYTGGISLLTIKNDLMLSYVHDLVLLSISKLSGHSLTEQDDQIAKELVKIRVVLEKLRFLEGKLRYQIEKLVRKAESGPVEKVTNEDEEEVINGQSDSLAPGKYAQVPYRPTRIPT